MDEPIFIIDPKKEIEFWLKALSNPNVSNENKKLLNECLQRDLKEYIYPMVLNPQLGSVVDNHPFTPFRYEGDDDNETT